MAKILVIDDDAANRHLISQLLGYGGHLVLEAKDAADGLALVRSERPDLLIVDIQMPGMDGYEFARQVQSEPEIKDSVIMFYTATYDPRRAQALAETMGVPFVLTKPIEPEKLFGIVERALASKRPAPAPAVSVDFDRAHFRLVADKLTDKVAEARTLSDRLTKLVELSLELTVEQDLRRLLDTFCRAGCDLMGARYTAIGIAGTGPGGLDWFVAHCHDDLPDVTPPPATSILSQLSEERNILCVNELDANPVDLGLPERFGVVRNLLAIAIASPKRSYGWIFFAQKGGGESFAGDDLRVARSLAAQVVVAYENATLYKESRQHAAELEARVAERTAELQRSHEELETSRLKELEVKDHFLAHVSHELRAPLAASHLFVSNLLDGVSGELTAAQLADLGVALKNINQLRAMIGDLLEATRADAGRLRIEMKATDLAGLISDTVAAFKLSAGAISLEKQIENGLPLVYADVQRVQQILNNLIDNAIKFTPPAGHVWIRALSEPKGNFVCVEVADTGRGLSPGGKTRVFERMYQDKPHEDLPRGGLGLGLYICRLLVERHGGSIWAESEPGAGSSFFFTLPVFRTGDHVSPEKRSNDVV